jgi:hypothetical protein
LGTIIDRGNMTALLEGVKAYSTGGGGSPEWGRAIMERDFAAGLRYELIDPEEVEEDSLTISGGFLGSVVEAMSVSEVVAGWDRCYEPVEALRLMEVILHRKVDYVIPFEMGALNTPAILSLGARAGLRIVDGDAVGRAAPETQMASFIGYGVSLTPMPLVDHYGNKMVVMDSAEPTLADEAGRWLVTKFPGMAANAHYPMSGAKLREAVIPNTVSNALKVGEAIMRARKAGENGFQAFSAASGARELIVGKIASMKGEDRGGFYFTMVTVDGTGHYEGHRAEIAIKNETMLLWLDGRLRVMFPDLICISHPETGEGLMTQDLATGQSIGVACLPCHPKLRAVLDTEIGVKSFGPQRYGYPSLAYRPLEDLT